MHRHGLRQIHDQFRAWLDLALALRPSPGTWAALVVGGLLVAFGSVYLATQHTVVLEVNGIPIRHRTHARSTQAVLREMGVGLQEKDILEAPSEDDLAHGAPLRLTVARQVFLVHDGSVSQVRIQARTVGEVIAEMGVSVRPHDQVYAGQEPCPLERPLPEATAPQKTAVKPLLAALRRPLHYSVRRAVSLSVQDGAVSAAFYTTARTVGEALYERGVVLYAADRLFPALETEITPGLEVIVERSKPLTLSADGLHTMLRTRLKTVAEVLAIEGIVLGPKDYATPAPSTPISRDLDITIVRVADEYYVEETPISFITRWEGSPDLELDETRVSNWGYEGAKRKRIRIHYEDNRELYRTEEEEWIARQPQDRIHQYGTKIVLRSLQTPSGAVTYWRKLRMYATSYNAVTAGVSPSSPWYGRTRLGLRAAKGIVAIDPRVIPLGLQVYVPGYGQAIAGDTGGGVKGRMIDLCYDDNNLQSWTQWVDVYLLAPVPPASTIDYRLNFPE